MPAEISVTLKYFPKRTVESEINKYFSSVPVVGINMLNIEKEMKWTNWERIRQVNYFLSTVAKSTR